MLTAKQLEDVRELANAAAKLSGSWQQMAGGRLSCERGDCVMGAILRSRLSKEALQESVESSQLTSRLRPAAMICAKLLEIPIDTALLIAHANDNMLSGSADYKEVRQILLDILQPKKHLGAFWGE